MNAPTSANLLVTEGGALELSLACHGRVVADDDRVKLALPEVKVGIFPGAGGTQRVPRLINTQDALQMMTTGQNLSPKKAKSLGLVHEVVPDDELLAALLEPYADLVVPYSSSARSGVSPSPV